LWRCREATEDMSVWTYRRNPLSGVGPGVFSLHKYTEIKPKLHLVITTKKELLPQIEPDKGKGEMRADKY